MHTVLLSEQQLHVTSSNDTATAALSMDLPSSPISFPLT